MEFILNMSKLKPGEEGYVQVEEKVQEDFDKPAGNSKHKSFTFPESKLKELRETYQTVVVRDFYDEYHMSDEQKLKEFDLYDVFNPIRKHKTKYRKIEEYIKAVRECYKFVVAMANKNRLIMNPDEFIHGVFSGEIEIAQLSFPKYIGPDKKDINWSEVTRYVLDDTLNPKDLSDKKEVNYLPVDVYENPEDHLNEYFTDEEVSFIFNAKDDNQSNTFSYDETYDDVTTDVVLPASKKKIKKLMKDMPDLIRPVKNATKNLLVDEAMHDFARDLRADAFEYISELDEKRGFMASDRMPKFRGNIMSKDDVNRYLYQLEEFEENYTRINYNGKFITVSEYKDEMLKEALVANGWDVTKLYSVKEEMKKQKEEAKRDEKKEKRLRKKLTRIKERKELRKEGKSDFNGVNTKKNKGKKKNKKKNKSFGKVLATGMTGRTTDFDEYEKMMLDMSYGYNE